ncbi:HDOD domain-containing protein [Thermodesulfobacteriota bacterium]
MNDKLVLLCFSIPEESKRIHDILKNEFNPIIISSPDELLRRPTENLLVLSDQEFIKQCSASNISNVFKEIEWPAILYIDPNKPDDYSEILCEFDISHVLVKHENDTRLIAHTIQKVFEVFTRQKSMSRAILQLKNKLDETKFELESTKKKLDMGSSPTEKVDILEEIIYVFKRGKIELPSHPKLSIKFKNLINKGASLNQIADILKQDAAITTKLVSISNSPYYRGISNNNTLEQAIGRLGLDTTKQYVDVILNRSLYLSKHKDFMEIIEKLWAHSLSCAYASQIVAERLGYDFEEDAFTLGLLHDIGKLILIQTIGELRKNNKLGENFDQSELLTSIINYHCKFGASLLKRWKFSQVFIDVAAFHGNLSEANNISKGFLIVNFSNLLVNSMGYGLLNAYDIDIEKEQSAILLKLEAEDIQEVSKQLQDLMIEFKGFFD